MISELELPLGKISTRSKWIADTRPLVRLIVPNLGEEFSVNQVRDALKKAKVEPPNNRNNWGVLTWLVKKEFKLQLAGRVLSKSEGANGRTVNLYRRVQ